MPPPGPWWAFGMVREVRRRRSRRALCSESCVLAMAAKLALCGDREHMVVRYKGRRCIVCYPAQVLHVSREGPEWDPWRSVPCLCEVCAKPMGLPAAHATTGGRGHYWPGSYKSLDGYARPSSVRGICSLACVCESHLIGNGVWAKIGDGAWAEVRTMDTRSL